MGRGPSIENRKNAEDARRGKIFTKLIREITIAARNGADPAGNARLRVAIDKALSANMTKDTIERAVKRGSGAEGADDMQELRYEGYGPSGVALIIDAMTDNPTRTVADIRHKMSRNGGNLGTPGSVSFMFEKKGQLTIDASRYTDEDATLEAALEAGAEDFSREDDEYVVTTDPTAFHAVRSALEAKGIVPTESELAMVPKSTVPVVGGDVESLLKLIETLEDLDDVQKVWANFEIDDAELAKLEG